MDAPALLPVMAELQNIEFDSPKYYKVQCRQVRLLDL